MEDKAPRIVTIIANSGLADKIVDSLIEMGFSSTATLSAKGTANQSWLHILGLGDVEKEIVFTSALYEDVAKIFDMLETKYRTKQKNNSCIAFSIKLGSVAGQDILKLMSNQEG